MGEIADMMLDGTLCEGCGGYCSPVCARQSQPEKRKPEPSAEKREQTRRKRTSHIRQYEGNDVYSWALFVHGKPVYTGMSRVEAAFRRRRYIKENKL